MLCVVLTDVTDHGGFIVNAMYPLGVLVEVFVCLEHVTECCLLKLSSMSADAKLRLHFLVHPHLFLR